MTIIFMYKSVLQHVALTMLKILQVQRLLTALYSSCPEYRD